MRKKCLLLPLVAIFCLSSCGKAKETVLPKGGKEVLKQEEKDARLVKAVRNIYNAHEKNDKIWFNFQAEAVVFSFDSPKLEMSSGIQFMNAFGVLEGLFTGNKETTRIGVSTGEFKAANYIHSDLEGEEKVDYEKYFKIRGMNFYLENGNAYIDLGSNNLLEILGSYSKMIAEFTTGYGEEMGSFADTISSIAQDEENTKSLIASFFGDNFNNKFKIEDVIDDDSYPLIDLSAGNDGMSDEEALKAAEDTKALFEQQSGLKWDNLCKTYSYGEDSAFQFIFPPADIRNENYPNGTEELGFKYTKGSYIELVAVFENNQLRDIGLLTHVGIEFTDEEITKACGGTLTATIAGRISLTLNYSGGDNISFPTNYDDYVSLNFGSSEEEDLEEEDTEGLDDSNGQIG